MCRLIARYGFQPGETGNARDDYRVVDESYTRQIPNVPQVTSGWHAWRRQSVPPPPWNTDVKVRSYMCRRAQLVPPLPSAAADGGYVGGALDDVLAPPPPRSGGYLKAGEGDLAMTWNIRISALYHYSVTVMYARAATSRWAGGESRKDVTHTDLPSSYNHL